MNENNNRVQSVIPEREFNQVMSILTEVDAILAPYMVGLTPAERMGLPKINVDNRDYVNDAINQMGTPAAQLVLPAFLKPADAVTDIAVYGQTEQISVQLMAIFSKVDATRTLSGSEAYTTALMFKKLAEAAEAAGVIGAAAIATALRERFKGNGNSGTDEDGGQTPTGGQ